MSCSSERKFQDPVFHDTAVVTPVKKYVPLTTKIPISSPPELSRVNQVINPGVVLSKESNQFGKPSRDSHSYVSKKNDARIIDPAKGGFIQTFSSPPISGSVKPENMYLPRAFQAGGQYNSYKDINIGQITYFVDPATKNPFYQPVYSQSEVEVERKMYIDPMGTVKPEILIKQKDVNQTTKYIGNMGYGLTSLRDSTSHREDLMALQRRKFNSQRWSVNMLE